MWSGLVELPEALSRTAVYYVHRCIYCDNRELTYSNTPMETMLRDGRMRQTITCNSCGKELKYLNERTYGLTTRELNSRQMKRDYIKTIWNRMPLWGLSNESER